MTVSRILMPLLFSKQGDDGQCEVRLITCTGSNEVRVYSRESVPDANSEVRLNHCRIYPVSGQSAPQFTQRTIIAWQETGFRPLNRAGRTFDFRTRTLTEGVGAIMNNTHSEFPAIRGPWWFT